MISIKPPKMEDDEGLLEYLEDIIGSSKFVEQTNEAAACVEALTEQRQEKLNRVKAVEKEKDCLEGAKLEAEALLLKEREIRRKKNISLQVNAMEANQDLEEANQKCNDLKENLNAVRIRIAEKEKEFSSIDSDLAEKTARHDKILKALKKAKDEFSYFERKDIQMIEELKHGKATMKKLDAKIKAEAAKMQEVLAKGEEANENIPVLEEKLAALMEQRVKEEEKLEKLYDDIRAVTEGLRQKLEEKTQELAPVQQERAVFQAALDTALTEAKLIEDSAMRTKEQLMTAEKELSSLDEKQSVLRSELAKCEDERAESKQRIVDAQKEDEVFASREKSLAKRNTELMVSYRKSSVLVCSQERSNLTRTRSSCKSLHITVKSGRGQGSIPGRIRWL